MTAHPWMPLYIADYIADTRRLRAAEHGAYLLLIMEYWQTGSLPEDDRQLARIACMSDREWRVARQIIEPLFQPGWRHKRIDAEMAQANAKRERRSEAGKKGGNARVAAQAMLGKKSSNAQASSSQSYSERKKQTLSADADGEPEEILPNETKIDEANRYSDEFEELWREYRAAINEKNSSKAKAFKAFDRLDDKDREDCFVGLVKYGQWVMEARKIRVDTPAKHLETFINARGWEPYLELVE